MLKCYFLGPTLTVIDVQGCNCGGNIPYMMLPYHSYECIEQQMMELKIQSQLQVRRDF